MQSFHIPAIPNGNRNLTVKNSQEHSLSSSFALPLPTLDLPESENFSENREENSLQDHCAQVVLMHQMHHKSTREIFGKAAKKYSDQLYL